ncbi:hypothetical protein SLE2022_004850 [Rubroshorea leprosula]
MEAKVPRPRGRPRKRRSPEDERIDAKSNSRNKMFAVEIRSIALVGRYVLKEFSRSRVFLGKIVSYDTGLYRVEYEDGNCEELDSTQLRYLILDDAYFDDGLIQKKKRLDELILEKISKKMNVDDLDKKVEDSKNVVDADAISTLSDLSGAFTVESAEEQVEDDAGSSSDSCEHVYDWDMTPEAEAPPVPPPELPSSSGTIGVPEEYVSHLFAVYGFLRSFSIQLFLSPFGLDEFVGALNCSAPNTLLDSVHFALLRALRQRLESLSSEGSEQALKCVRNHDWSLLDTLTWPVYLIQYITVMGYIKGPDWQGFCKDVSKGEYYSLPVGRKLMNLQFLCDDVLESVELRAEIDMREESEVGIDPDAVPINNPENGPRRVYLRFSKTSACKEKETMEMISGIHELNSSCKSKYFGDFGFKGTQVRSNAIDVNLDANSDECRLCGMDGTLLCCDGCPSAYHSRCIGVMKMYIPDGSWYCPECTANKIGPSIAVGTSLRGAELFGFDLHGHAFFGTCNHLLVLKASINLDPYLRYYNLNDIPKVLKVLSSLIHCEQQYLGICKAIMKYWNLPDSICFPMETIEPDSNVETVKKDEKPAAYLLPPGNGSCKFPDIVDAENTSSFNANADNERVSYVNSSADMMNHTGLPVIKLSVKSNVEPAMSAGSVRQQAGTSDVTYQSLVDRSTMIDLATPTCGKISGSYLGLINDKNLGGSGSHQSKADKQSDFGSDMKISVTVSDSTYMGLSYKPQAYVNHYNHGEIAAVAAAKLAILSSEESQVAGVNRSGSTRKFMSTSDFSLQAKAFSSIASRFFWPSVEKKSIEALRERCGWCHSCKECKRGCMLNSAVSSATKSAKEILNGLPPIKNKDGSLPCIATYILYMEESLCGLVAGPFLNQSYRKQWRKKLEDASTLSAMKVCLLELEKNIPILALSTDWVKLMDDWMVESSMMESTTSTSGLTQKRGPGRRSKKLSGTCEISADDSDDTSVTWWRGGRLTNHIFQKAILPCSMVKKAARGGGATKIAGVSYIDGSEIPKRNRQLLWRAAVERSRNLSQLALQVRYLDLHVRWNDLVRPEQNPQDGKGVETEASVFRNATICDKKIVENKIIYGIAFGNQKHLPSRVMKNIINIDQNGDGMDKYWLHETRIPLYLIKEYEEKVGKALLTPVKKPSKELSELQKRQLKASRRNMFVYLVSKRDKLENCSCASCQLDVLLRDAITCSTCQGYCHKYCTLSSIQVNGKVEHFIICELCSHAKGLAQNDISNKSPTTPLFLHGREWYNTMTATKSTQVKGSNQLLKPLTSLRSGDGSIKTKENCPDVKHAASGSSMMVKPRNRLCHWGVIWRKRNSNETGIDFRLTNLLPRGGSDNYLLKPVCQICKQPYNSELIYIHCETCKKWYHADAVELEESRISDVIGFKCCKCRRIRGPECPHMDPELRDQKRRKQFTKARKQGQETEDLDFDCGTVSETKECKPTISLTFTTDDLIPDDDHLLFSLSKVEEIKENAPEADLEWNGASGIGLKKLPVRRQVKQEDDEDGFSGANHFHTELSIYHEPSNQMKPKEEPSLPFAQWNVSSSAPESELLFDYESLNYEDMEFEPQTYFSLNELLASDDGDDEVDDTDPAYVSRIWENPLSSALQDGDNEQCQEGTYSNQAEPIASVKSDVNELKCRLCFLEEPSPDLLCRICGFLIHSHCSPWNELAPLDSSWSCGRCRERC